jgi:hypothetical protein
MGSEDDGSGDDDDSGGDNDGDEVGSGDDDGVDALPFERHKAALDVITSRSLPGDERDNIPAKVRDSISEYVISQCRISSSKFYNDKASGESVHKYYLLKTIKAVRKEWLARTPEMANMKGAGVKGFRKCIPSFVTPLVTRLFACKRCGNGRRDLLNLRNLVRKVHHECDFKHSRIHEFQPSIYGVPDILEFIRKPLRCECENYECYKRKIKDDYDDEEELGDMVDSALCSLSCLRGSLSRYAQHLADKDSQRHHLRRCVYDLDVNTILVRWDFSAYYQIYSDEMTMSEQMKQCVQCLHVALCWKDLDCRNGEYNLFYVDFFGEGVGNGKYFLMEACSFLFDTPLFRGRDHVKFFSDTCGKSFRNRYLLTHLLGEVKHKYSKLRIEYHFHEEEEGKDLPDGRAGTVKSFLRKKGHSNPLTGPAAFTRALNCARDERGDGSFSNCVSYDFTDRILSLPERIADSETEDQVDEVEDIMSHHAFECVSRTVGTAGIDYVIRMQRTSLSSDFIDKIVKTRRQDKGWLGRVLRARDPIAKNQNFATFSRRNIEDPGVYTDPFEVTVASPAPDMHSEGIRTRSMAAM